MTYLSIIEKLKILFDTMMDFEFILVFTVLLIVLTFLYIIKKLNTKKYIIMLLLSFIVVFGISIFSNYKTLSNTFDNFFTIFFGNIYFPSIYVYISVLVISFISFIVSISNIMLNKIYKIVNSVMFVINNLLFVIILNIIAKNNIDIFSINSLYTNTSLVAILELSMGLFILWVFTLITIYVTNTICIRISNKKDNKKIVNEELFSPVLEISNDTIVDVNSFNDSSDVITETEVETISSYDTNLVVEEINDNQNIVIEPTIENNITFNDILNGCVPVTYYDNSNVIGEYSLTDPQTIYENNYNKVKEEIIFNNINLSLDDDDKFSIEELTIKEKEKLSEERLSINTISLNDLIEEDNISEIDIKENNNILDEKNIVKEENISGYSVDDYKKIIKMLTEIKNYSNGTSINIDDAVAIGLINNYSIDDCMKFKNILENNLN